MVTVPRNAPSWTDSAIRVGLPLWELEEASVTQQPLPRCLSLWRLTAVYLKVCIPRGLCTSTVSLRCKPLHLTSPTVATVTALETPAAPGHSSLDHALCCVYLNSLCLAVSISASAHTKRIEVVWSAVHEQHRLCLPVDVPAALRPGKCRARCAPRQ